MPYRGTSLSVADVMGGTIDAAFGDVSNLLPFVEGGKLARSARRATSARPCCRTCRPWARRASGRQDRELVWSACAVWNARGDSCERSRRRCCAAQDDPDFKDLLGKNATTTGTLGAEAFDKMIQEERERLDADDALARPDQLGSSREIAEAREAMDVRRLIDVENGTASREIFVDRDIYRQEQEQIFARAWLFVGHECQVPNPDDFFVSRMGEESVILTRDRQGKLHVLLNTCGTAA